MVTRVSTVAFEGIEGRAVDVQVQISAGQRSPSCWSGLPDKAVGESKREGALCAARLGTGAAGEAHHGQPRAGRSAQGGLALRSADRARHHGGDRGDPGRCALDGYTVLGELGLDGIDRPRSRACCRRRSPRPPAVTGLICPARLRARGRVGVARRRHPGAALARAARQPLQGRPGAWPGPSRPIAPPSAIGCPTCETSKARRAPSGCSRSRPPAVTTS